MKPETGVAEVKTFLIQLNRKGECNERNRKVQGKELQRSIR